MGVTGLQHLGPVALEDGTYRANEGVRRDVRQGRPVQRCLALEPGVAVTAMCGGSSEHVGVTKPDPERGSLPLSPCLVGHTDTFSSGEV